jgi:hypothetical protein
MKVAGLVHEAIIRRCWVFAPGAGTLPLWR